jgi:hypothetical protein
MRIEKNGQAIKDIEDWRNYGGPKREMQWSVGRSAFECAHAWCSDSGLSVPQELIQLLDSHPVMQAAKFISATPEYRVRFDRLRGEPRNSDMVAVAENEAGIIAISIEAKADELFGDSLQEIYRKGNEKLSCGQKTNAIIRLENLKKSLLPNETGKAPDDDALRYQLLTGVAGSLAFALEVGADKAVFIVHEFITDKTKDAKHEANTLCLNQFANRITAGAVGQVTPGQLYGPLIVPGNPLFAAPPALYIGKAIRNVRV